MAETLNAISILCYILAGSFAILAIVLWFVFKIPSVLGDLSGINARKSIEKMRNSNTTTGEKYYQSSERNFNRGKLTIPMEDETNSESLNETGLLNINSAYAYPAKEVLLQQETGSLTEEDNTIVQESQPHHLNKRKAQSSVEILQEIMYTYTDEEII